MVFPCGWFAPIFFFRLFNLLKNGADVFKETALHYHQEGEAKDHELASADCNWTSDGLESMQCSLFWTLVWPKLVVCVALRLCLYVAFWILSCWLCSSCGGNTVFQCIHVEQVLSELST
jgi:hypothetical protein